MQHMYYDVSDLNAPYDSVPLQGVGAGILTSGAMGSLGGPLGQEGVDVMYPWMEISPDTKILQQKTNVELKSRGYCTISEDGKLGPATCGAVRELIRVTGENVTPPDTCQSYTAPRKPPCGGAVAPAVMPVDTSVVTATSRGGGTNWVLLGGLLGVAAIGGALYFKKKKRR